MGFFTLYTGDIRKRWNQICFPDEHHVAPPQSRGSLRDRMLKEPDTPPGGSNRQIFDFEESPSVRSPSLVSHNFINYLPLLIDYNFMDLPLFWVEN